MPGGVTRHVLWAAIKALLLLLCFSVLSLHHCMPCCKDIHLMNLYCALRIKNSSVSSIPPMFIRSYIDDVMIWQMPLQWLYERQNRQTKSTRKWTFVRTSVNFFACQRFCLRSRSCYRGLDNTTGSHMMGKDGFANGPMFSNSRSDPNLNIFILVCSSAFKFRTVWRQHKDNERIFSSCVQKLYILSKLHGGTL